MIVFKEMRLTVYRRHATKAWPKGEGMVAWEASQPLIGDLDDKKYTSEVGIKNLSFYFTLTEFRGVMDGRMAGCTDIGHSLRATGDMFTFFNMEYPSAPRGVMHVPYVVLHVPYYVRRILGTVLSRPSLS